VVVKVHLNICPGRRPAASWISRRVYFSRWVVFGFKTSNYLTLVGLNHVYRLGLISQCHLFRFSSRHSYVYGRYAKARGVQPSSTAGPNAHNHVGPRDTAASVQTTRWPPSKDEQYPSKTVSLALKTGPFRGP